MAGCGWAPGAMFIPLFQACSSKSARIPQYFPMINAPLVRQLMAFFTKSGNLNKVSVFPSPGVLNVATVDPERILSDIFLAAPWWEGQYFFGMAGSPVNCQFSTSFRRKDDPKGLLTSLPHRAAILRAAARGPSFGAPSRSRAGRVWGLLVSRGCRRRPAPARRRSQRPRALVRSPSWGPAGGSSPAPRSPSCSHAAAADPARGPAGPGLRAERSGE